MPYLVDTNVLLRSSQPGHSMYGDAVNAIAVLRSRGEELHVVPAAKHYKLIKVAPVSIMALPVYPYQSTASRKTAQLLLT